MTLESVLLQKLVSEVVQQRHSFLVAHFGQHANGGLTAPYANATIAVRILHCNKLL